MKRVTAFVGTNRRKSTYSAVYQFMNNLRSLGDVDTEIVSLSDYRLGICRGCKKCFEKGEEFCPLQDDRDVLIEKIIASDGFVLASPNYSFQISGLTKMFLDRLGFAFHRPRFSAKPSPASLPKAFSEATKSSVISTSSATGWASTP